MRRVLVSIVFAAVLALSISGRALAAMADDIDQKRLPIGVDNLGNVIYAEEGADADSVGIVSADVDLGEFIQNGRFDFTQFEVNEELGTTKPQIEQTQAKETDPAMNTYYTKEELKEDTKTVVTPGRADYYIDIEVGRIAHIFPTNKVMNTFTVADSSIMGQPYRYEEPGFEANYRAHAYKPGDTVITCTHSSNNVVDFIEEWHVHVYCRDISFEQDEYVVEKSKKGSQYLTLQLREFEYTVDRAYDFVWTSSNESVAAISSGWKGTRCYATVKSAGATIITVTDIYGNSRSTLLVVKEDPKLTAETVKALLKKTSVSLKTKSFDKLVKLTFANEGETTLDGYQIYVSTDGKDFTKLKTIKSGTVKSFSDRKAKAGKTYYYKIRGYKEVGGKKLYTAYSEVVKGKLK